MSLSLMVFSVLLNRINIAIKSIVKVIKLRHNRKICNLRKRHGIDKLPKTKPSKNLINNFSSYNLTDEEIQALSHGLDQFHQIQINIKLTTTSTIFIKIF